MGILQIGAGGVGWVIAHKLAQHNTTFGDIHLASRRIGKCGKIIESIERRRNRESKDHGIFSHEVNANDLIALIQLIKKVKPKLVINAGPPWVNVSIMEACCQTQTAYLDTSVATDLCSEGQQVPEAYDPQWAFRARFEAAGVMGILGAGFDPGVVSVFAAYAYKHLFDEIDSIDVMDVNAGDHGKKFATNFDAETNMLEIQGDSFYWENNAWQQVPCHSRRMIFDFPLVGTHSLYSMAHDEVRSLKEFIPAKRIEFWMGFSDRYLTYFNCFRDIGLLENSAIELEDGRMVEPLKVLKALLPNPTSLAENYTGKTCIATWVQGKKQGERRSVLIYNSADHQEAYKDVEHQAIAYTTGIPAVTAALLFFTEQWQTIGLFNLEQLNPDPFLALMPTLGLDWHCLDMDDQAVKIESL